MEYFLNRIVDGTKTKGGNERAESSGSLGFLNVTL